MDGSSGASVAPFLLKIYEMVDDDFTNAVVSWSQNGHSFVVWDPPEFSRVLLPNYFKHNNFSSFIRQLNTYGFRKIDPVQWEFANEEFIRGKAHLLKNIHRRKPTHSHSAQGNAHVAPPLTESERQEFRHKIEILRQENLSLQSSLERERVEGVGYGDELRSLGQVLQTIDFRHGEMMTTLSQLLQKPGADQYPFVVMEPLESHAKKRRLLASTTTCVDMSSSSPSLLPLVKMGQQVEKLDSAITCLEKLFHEIEVSSGEFTSSGDSELNNITPPRQQCVSSIHIEASKQKLSGMNDVFWQQFLTEAPASTKN